MDMEIDDAPVSRSGRVRKKSSKLTDFFESAEEQTSPKGKRGNKRSKVVESNSDASSDYDEDLSDSELKEGEVDFDAQWDDLDENSALLDPKDDSDDDSLNLGDTPYKNQNFAQDDGSFNSDKKKSTTRRKVTKKTNASNKPRITAYMVWSKHVRSEIIQQYPTMDFSAINKRLGELWAVVPTAQKYNWQRKAAKLAMRTEKKSRGSMISTGKPKRIAKAKDPKNIDLRMPNMNKASVPKHSVQQVVDTSPSGGFRVNGTSPIDVAAYLKLLGESLNNIGQKLKEHEGQIAVSGSLSVLLDSILCVLGPLACLTNELDELKDSISESTRNRILDNIAYIMPGIV